MAEREQSKRSAGGAGRHETGAGPRPAGSDPEGTWRPPTGPREVSPAGSGEASPTGPREVSPARPGEASPTGSGGTPSTRPGGLPPPVPPFTVLARHRRELYGLSLRVTALTAVVGALILAGWFAAAWPTTVEAQGYLNRVRAMEDPAVGYSLETFEQMLVLSLVLISLLVTVAGFVTSTLLTGHVLTAARAAGGRRTGPGGLWRATRTRLRRAVAAQFLAGLFVLGLLLIAFILTFGIHDNAFLGEDIRDFTFPPELLTVPLGVVLPVVLTGVAVFLGVRFFVAATVAALEDLPAVTALRRSWSLVRGAWFRTAGTALLVVVVTVAGYVLLQYLTDPLGALFPDKLDGNQFEADLVAELVPVGLALLLTPLLTMPVVYPAVAWLTLHLTYRHDSDFPKRDDVPYL